MLGSWTVSSANAAPAAVSVTPLSGSGSSRTFSFIFSDPNGFADLSSVRVIVHSQIQGASSCYLYYTRHANKLYLHNDPATALLGPLTPGISGTVQNSQCSVNAASSSVSSSSTNLTLNLAMSFTGGYSGTKSVFGFATDQAGLDSGWQTLGSWTVSSVNAAPSAVSTTPPSGSGSSQMFSFLFSDPDGFADLSSVRVIVHSQVQGAASCYLYYTRGDNKLYLHSDAATALLGPLTPGVAGTIQNSQCSVNGATSSVSSSGTNLTLNLAMSFTVSYSGAKSVFGYATDQAGLNGAWAPIGSWTVP